MKQDLRARGPESPSNWRFIEPLEGRTLMAAVKIMPLGDSITESDSGHSSYRYWLWNQLGQAGYDVDFVGSMTGVSGGSPLNSGFDQNHEGHSGYHADQIRSNIIAWATQNRPDVVLLHAGTNDISVGQSASGIISEIGGIIDNLRLVNPNVTILLARIIPSTNHLNATQQFDNLIPDLAAQKNTTASRVVVVDQYSGFNPSTDTYDGIHPTTAGEQKMSAKWYSALTGVLPAPVPLPPGTYLSDMSWTSMTNGWGAVEKDRSNGEQGTGDGGTITLNGIAYRKGLGVHATSSITYNIGAGTYSEFRADIGVDDEAGSGGSVVFQVYINNTLKYTSAVLRGSSATVPIAIAIPAGSTSLRLVVNDGGDGDVSDHGDWAMARLISGTPSPTPTPTPTPTPAPTPAAPTGLSATFNNNRVNLKWTDKASNETGFRVERRTANGAWIQIATLSAGAQSFSDSNISGSTTYYYRVSAFNSSGSSGFTNEAVITTPRKVRR